MDLVKQFREYTRQLECHLENINRSDCCCCSVSQAQCFVLVEIGRKPGISVKELSEILHIDKSGVSRSVEDLVKKGFVERNTSKKDRRYVTLALTSDGDKRFQKIENDMYSVFQTILEQIPTEKQEQVIEALRLFNEACTKAEEREND